MNLSLPAARRWFVPLLLVALTLLLSWPLPIQIGTHVPDRQDPLLNAWIMAWEARQLLIDPRGLFDANIFYPQRNTLAFSETLISLTAIILPVQWGSDNALLSHNVAFLLAFFTTALGGYLLALYLTGRRGPAIVAALALAWAPYRIGQISQVQLLAFGWLPLALIYLDRLLRRRLNDRGWRKEGVLFALFFLLQTLTSFYASLFTVAAVILYLVGWWIWRRHISATAWLALAATAVVVAVVMLPLVRPYLEVQRTLSAGWDPALNEQFSASAQSYAYAPPLTHFWGPITDGLYYTHGACCPPSTLFPGVTVLLLSAVALLVTSSRRRWILLLIGLTGFVLSFGPTLSIMANEPTSVALPYQLLLDYVPGFDGLRAPVRWAVLVTLSLAMLTALGLARLRRPWLTFLAFALVLLEFSPAPLRLVATPAPFPSLDWLDDQASTLILELPLVADRVVPPFERPRDAWEQSRLLEAQYFSTWHWHATPDGYSGYVPTRHGDLAREIRAFPSTRSAILLRGLGVRYLVIHEADLRDEQLAALGNRLPEGVRDHRRISTDRILELDPLVSVRPRFRLPLTAVPADQTVTVPLVVVPNQPFVPLPRDPIVVEARWEPVDSGRTWPAQRIRVAMPLIIEEVGVLPLVLAAPPAGDWTLTVSGAVAPSGTFTASQEVRSGADVDAPPPFVPVRLDDVSWLDPDTVMLRWWSDAPLTRYYSVAVQRLDSGGNVIAEQNGPPGGAAGTLGWQPGQPYATRWSLPLPDGISPADTTLRLRWYDPETGEVVWLWNGEEFTALLTR